MGYGDRSVNLYDKKVMGLTEWGTRLRDYVEDVARGVDRGIHPIPGVLFMPVDLDITVPDEFSFDPLDSDYVSGLGHAIEDVAAAVLTAVPFENAAVTDYDIGVKRIQIPYLAETCVRDGTPQYRAWEERIGNVSIPTSVAYAAGTLSIDVSAACEMNHDFTGRSFVVWLDVPVTDQPAAIETCVGYFDIPTNHTWIDLAATLGQGTSPSTTAADYRVALLGPMVKKFSSLKASTTGIVYIGTITGGGAGFVPAAKDLTDQFVYPDVGQSWYDIFEVCAHGNAKVRVRAYAADGADEPQLSIIEDITGNRTWQVQRDGDMEMGNAVDFVATSPSVRFLTSTRSVDVHCDPGVTDYFRITPDVPTCRTKIVSNVVEIEEGVEAVGTLKFEDVNTAAQIPFSSASDTALRANLQGNLIGAINESSYAITGGNHYIGDGVLSGGVVSMPGGTDLNILAGEFMQEGQYKSIAGATLNGIVANCYVYAIYGVGGCGTGSSYVSNAVLPPLSGGTVLLAYVAAGGGGPTAVTDLRRWLSPLDDRDDIIVGMNSGGSAMVTGAAFNNITDAIAWINVAKVPKQRQWRIRVAGYTTEPATITVPNNVTIDGDGCQTSLARVYWGFDEALFDFAGASNATVRKLIVQHTGANPPPGSGLRCFAKCTGAAAYNRLEEITYAGAIDLNGVCNFGTHAFSYGVIAGLREFRATDYGIALLGTQTAIERCPLHQCDVTISATHFNAGIRLIAAASSCVVRDCDLRYWDGNGISVDAAATGNHIDDVVIAGVGLDGISLSTAVFNWIRGCHVQTANGLGGTGGLVLAGSTDNFLIGNKVAGSTVGISFDATSDRNIAMANALTGLGIADAGAGNLYLAATDSDPLNIP